MARRRCGEVNVRIVSGRFGGRKLDAPNGRRTHPMSERVRAALFNSLLGQIEGAEVLDAFAGTGALGLEALSRGAAVVTFIEKDKIAQQVIAKNIETLGVSNQTALVRTTVNNWLETTAEPPLFDIIFADPPYHDEQFSTVKKLFTILKPNGLMVLSHSGRGEVPIQNGIVVVDNRSYGNAHLAFFRREEHDA